MTSEKKIRCKDCGPNPTIHWIEKSGVYFNLLFRPYAWLMEKAWRLLRPLVSFVDGEKFNERILRLLAALGIGTLKKEISQHDGWRTKVMWQEASKRGIQIEEFWLWNQPRELFIASYTGATRVFQSLPRPKGEESASMQWMDDKGILQKKLDAAGVPVPKSQTCFTFRSAKKFFDSINAPVIAKPNVGSRARHTTLHINSEKELRRGFEVAKKLSPFVVIQEELKGFVWRVTLVGGEVKGVLRREFPHVVGDGVLTISELIDRENLNPKRRGPLFEPLPRSHEVSEELKRQHLNFDSIPEKEAMVTLLAQITRGVGASNTDFTDQIHPENVVLFKKIHAVIADPLIGIDFIIDDISLPWQKQLPCGPIECNSMPFIDLHYFPLVGQKREIASPMWDLALPQSRRS